MMLTINKNFMTRILSFTFFLLLFAGCAKEDYFNPDLAIDQRTITLNASADTTKIMVYSNKNWTIEYSDQASWITIPKASGTGKAYAIVSVTDNSAGLPRAATLVIKAGAKSDTIRLGQKGIIPQIAITATMVSSLAAGGTIQTAIETNLPLSIMNVTYTYASGSNWISGLQIVNKTSYLTYRPIQPPKHAALKST
jgi:hypothetical protein